MGTGGFGVPQSLSCTSGHMWLSVLHHGEVTVSPWYNKWGRGFVHSQVVVLLLGTSPCSWR